MSDLIYANSAISAYMSEHMLNQPRIHALIRAKTWEQTSALLAECDYQIESTNIDMIIDSEHSRAKDKFIKLCPDVALNNCVLAIFDFTGEDLNDDTLSKSEKALYATLSANIDSIKYEKAREYFKTYTQAFTARKKIPDKALFNIASDMKYDNTTIGPIFYWYVLKQSEFIVVKTILLGKQLEFPSEKILTSLKKGGLYERFN